MKSLRRSLVSKDSATLPTGNARISTPVSLPAVSKPVFTGQPPTKVIKAVESYRPLAPQELGFSKGDFFHVIRELDRGGQWYEAHNPMTGARGLVPRAMFEAFGKNDAATRVSTVAAGPRNALAAAGRPPAASGGNSPSKQTFYAIVVHDFAAERPDELDARAGDAISVVAQSNREWFVAKPIGKLGRPGLIPISFVEMRDPATGLAVLDVRALLDRGDIPLVDEWKRAMNQYKAASIPLGVLDDPGYGPVPNSPFTPPSGNGNGVFEQSAPYPSPPSSIDQMDSRQPPEPQSNQSIDAPPLLPEGILFSADVVSFHFENDEYWFRVNALFQPEDESSATHGPLPALQLVLFRMYEDFYDFQITLLDTFPVEAGRAPPSNNTGPSSPTRILPYMPGPVPAVDALVTAERRVELDDYVRQLCLLRECNAEHILRHELLRAFFAPRAGDAEVEVAPVYPVQGGEPARAEDEQYSRELEGLSVADRGDDDGEYYAYDPDAPQAYPGGSSRSPPPTQPERTPSRMTNGSRSRQESAPRPLSPYSMPRHASPQPGSTRQTNTPWDGYSQYSDGPGASYAGRPGSTASTTLTSSAHAPPVSATNPQPAFVKIKIFDRATDDLIAIRVPPRVTHRQLMDKVRERLGGEVASLRYRNSLSGQFLELHEDDLRNWLETADKLVLYAE